MLRFDGKGVAHFQRSSTGVAEDELIMISIIILINNIKKIVIIPESAHVSVPPKFP